MKPLLSSTGHMTISPISKLTTVCSGEVTIHGIPWKVAATKNGAKKSLAVFLYCDKKGSSTNWAVPACASIKLLSADDGSIKHDVTPYVFTPSCIGFGATALIQWDDLLKDGNKYVRDDTIELEFQITAQDPNHVDSSVLKLETVDKSCDCGSLATFRLTVANVKNLLAVRSPKFILRGLSWDLSIYKHQSCLGMMLEARTASSKISCKMAMSVKVLSSKNDAAAIIKSTSGQIEWLGILKLNDIAPWNEMLKVEKRFVNNDAIVLEVEIKAQNPLGGVLNAGPKGVAKPLQFECSICLEVIGTLNVSATPCCHLFCTACITKTVRNRGACPLCQAAVQLTDLRRMYLSA